MVTMLLRRFPHCVSESIILVEHCRLFNAALAQRTPSVCPTYFRVESCFCRDLTYHGLGVSIPGVDTTRILYREGTPPQGVEVSAIGEYSNNSVGVDVASSNELDERREGPVRQMH
ncbi:hypothetical protein F442_01652 [Phytophthora nicotianae P10297]|uniref:Uncharacterized protein n=1 Tax=Phytophthora nicotianae P10297 TaxID=1317064 RepID=W3A1L9_PHYNI|nr:hypothetical protein F442_01652 [Phytophthora nicotianae P10297]